MPEWLLTSMPSQLCHLLCLHHVQWYWPDSATLLLMMLNENDSAAISQATPIFGPCCSQQQGAAWCEDGCSSGMVATNMAWYRWLVGLSSSALFNEMKLDWSQSTVHCLVEVHRTTPFAPAGSHSSSCWLIACSFLPALYQKLYSYDV